MTIAQSLLTYIADTWMKGDAAGLDENVPLLELNIIDSTEIFDLVHYVQSEYRVTVPLREVAPDNFRTVGAIAALVERLRAESGSLR
ncbi:acyl carrier protein [Actinocrinis puniceicyclus]|uniref:Acyl carrier protein n=1 Tax=Actinocrinis puniceicyclus TaxID=977794 RepID=A0A8J7WPM3_9ACTN|nr:acyl carrier protein [Actinocrinis puniceicyclus]MBS2963704.1 acyl carrier protein [Actinocrinis puniceicyclus]